MKNFYPETTEGAFRIVIPFVSTYLSMSEFLTLVQIKSKQTNRLDVEDDLRCALSQTLLLSMYSPMKNKNKFHID